MVDTQSDNPITPYEPGLRAARAVFVLLAVELLISLYVLMATASWQSTVLTASGLALAIFTAWLREPSRKDAPQPWHNWAFLAVIWLSLNLFAFLTAGLWLGLATANILLTIPLAAFLFARAQSSRPMLLSVLTALPIVLIGAIFQPEFRQALPDPIPLLLPYFLGLVAISLLVYLLGHFALLSLRQKLIISFLVLSLLPMASIRYLYDLSFRTALTESASQNLFSVASQTAGAIDAFISSHLDSIAVQSQLPTFQHLLTTSRDDPEYEAIKNEANKLIYNLQELHGHDENSFLISHFLLDQDGMVVLDTSVPDGAANPFIGSDLSRDAVFLSPALIGLPYASPIRVPGGMDTARIFFAHRITNEENQPVGVFATSYRAEFLQQLLVENAGLAGEGSYGVLFDENKIFLAHARRPDLVLQSVVDLSPDLTAELVAAGRLPEEPEAMTSIGFTELADKLGNAAREPLFTVDDETAGGTTTQVAASRLSNYPWRVAFFQSQDNFLAPVVTQTFNSLLLAAIIAAGAVFIALLASNQLAGPILRLTKIAEEVSSGNLNVEAPVEAQDEVGILAMTFNSMTRQLRETLAGLENLVAERTSRLEATNEVGRVASSILNADELISRIVNLITERFGYYYAAIFLIDPEGKWAVLQNASGEAGAELKARGHRLEIGGRSMVGSSISRHRARIALDVGSEAARFDNPLLPETRSEIALPLIVGDEVLGALDVQSTEEAAFKTEDIDTLQTLASQVAIAIENANLFKRTQRDAESQERMNQFSAKIQRAPDVDGILMTAVTELAALMEASEITIQLAPEKDLKKSTNGSGQPQIKITEHETDGNDGK